MILHFFQQNEPRCLFLSHVLAFFTASDGIINKLTWINSLTGTTFFQEDEPNVTSLHLSRVFVAEEYLVAFATVEGIFFSMS